MVSELLTINEASALYKLSPETVRRWCAAGEIISYRHGAHGHYRIDKASLQAVLQRHIPPEPVTRFDLKALGKQILADMRAAKQLH